MGTVTIHCYRSLHLLGITA